jgi:uncharacterized protein YndB with AHSA1/START domain
MLNARQPATFLIADISGYTGYLATVELDHAQDILADLIGAVVSALRPTFKLAKLEGDAAFTFAPGDTVDGSVLLDVIERCYLGFRRRRRDVRQATSCECNACSRIPDLDLKFVVHHGEAILQRVAGRQELLGSDVITVHRLLKNDVVQRTGIQAYALLSQGMLDAAGLDPVALGMRAHVESVEGAGEISAWVHDLEPVWQAEEARTRVRVEPDDAIMTISVPTSVPPQVAWEFMTTPAQRTTWQPWIIDVDVTGTTGGRRGTGSVNHCRHGKDVTLEEVLDWRPYDYVTYRITTASPAGPLKLPETLEFEPTTDGTTIHIRFGAPTTKQEQRVVAEVGRGYQEAIESVIPSLLEQLEARNAERTADDA